MARRITKEKELDIGWNHGKMVANDHRHVKCNYCGKEMHGGITRLKEHLAGIAGDVMTCKEVPKEVRKEIKEHIFAKRKEKQTLKFEKKKMQEELMTMHRGANSDEDDEDEDEGEEERDIRRALRESRQAFAEEEMRIASRRIGAGSSMPPRDSTKRPSTFPRCSSVGADPFTLKKQGKTQSTIKAAMKGIKDAKKYLGRAVAKFMYYNHIPHNVANSPYYQTMADAFADVGRGVPPPTAWELSNTYLDMEVDETTAYIYTFIVIGMSLVAH